jgi:hypothetical protein
MQLKTMNLPATLRFGHKYTKTYKIRRVQWFRLSLSKVPNKVGVSLPSLKDGNRYSFRNAVFRLFRIPNNGQVHKPSDSRIKLMLLTYFKRKDSEIISSIIFKV